MKPVLVTINDQSWRVGFFTAALVTIILCTRHGFRITEFTWRNTL